MQIVALNGLINTATACRLKAAALRREVETLNSPAAIKSLLEIADHWDVLAVEYERTTDNTTA